jgi:hypothetical protein
MKQANFDGGESKRRQNLTEMVLDEEVGSNGDEMRGVFWLWIKAKGSRKDMGSHVKVVESESSPSTR